MKKVKKVLKFIWASIMMIIANIINLFFEKKRKKIWLIAEQRNMARDNGIAFYHYCKENTNHEVYYLINKKSSDYKGIKYKDNVIQYGSLKHYRYYLKASILITCFEGTTCPSYLLEKILQKYKILKAKQVFLQHGIIKDYIEELTYLNYKPDLFITSTKPEYEYIAHHYGHPKGVVQLTGLARYDHLVNLSNHNKVKILIMPTWRRWVTNNFETTEFYKNYIDLMKRIQEKYNSQYTILFYLHSNFQKYSCYFQKFKNIKILMANDYKVDQLLKESNLLITDYSSVAFDFAYLCKPIIYFQFDYEKIRKQHYQEGYFNYQNNGFGPIVFQARDVVKEIEKCEDNKFNNSEQYINRINQTFTFKDNHNCERILKKIEEIEGEKYKC
ncbi:MAG: hypothetical protein HFJ35_07870 [Clostridia bacterium]|nr:hypothetical protein [Clostridia bacterium]